jgi:hypothetical protein
MWALRIATLFFVLGTAQYASRDVFHADESIVQPVVEASSVILGSLATLGVLLTYPTRLRFRVPYLLLLGTLVLAIFFSPRSWDPLLSAARGFLLVLISLSGVALARIYGFRAVVRSLLHAYFLLIIAGVVVGLLAPDVFPLMLHDPGEEAVRSRLHLFRVHPIALADDCAICLLFSVLVSDRWIRLYRMVFVVCLLLTVTRASIGFCLPLYLLAEFVFARDTRKGICRLGVVVGVTCVTIGIAIGLVLTFSDWSRIEEVEATVGHVVDATKDNVTLNGRTSVWSMLVADLSFDNVYGYGVGGARYYLRSVNPWFSHSHNSALETIYISGYSGLAMAIAALLGGLIGLAAHWRRADARLLIVVLCYAIGVGMMNPSWYETSSLLVLSIACVGPWLPARPVSELAERCPVYIPDVSTVG